jgi:2-polyprenyl-3-methyl-5-hydroxy-6-metoxy-1,4-benzoquinol methylase
MAGAGGSVSRTRLIAQRLFPVLVSTLALVWLASRFDMGRVVDALSWRVALVMLPALLIYGVITLLIESFSILRLIESPPPQFGAWTAARVKCASYLLAIVNYALGGAALSVLLRRRARIGLGQAASIVVLISLTDLVVVLALGTSSLASAALDPPLLTGIVSLAGVGFFGGLVLLRMPGSLGPLDRIRSLSVFDALRDTPPRRLGELALMRLVFSISFIGVAGAGFVGFDIDVGALRLVSGVMILAVVGALPIAVAGLGTGQVAAVYVFQGIAPEETLIALSLVLSAGLIGLRAVMGIVFAREFTREALAETRLEAPEQITFTGERLHAGEELFAVDLARHQAAYELAREWLGRGAVLDLGCGSGYGTASLGAEGVSVVGLDRVVPDAASRNSNGHFVRADLSGIPLAPQSFGLVISFQVIEHLEDPTDYIDAIATLLRPEGAALVTTPNILMSDGVNPYHVHEYVADELGERLRERFAEVEVKGIGATEPIHRHLAERSRRIRRIMRLDPLRLRDRLPRSLVEWLFARFALLVRSQARDDEGLPEVGWRDFPVGPADERCLDLLAICRKPR